MTKTMKFEQTFEMLDASAKMHETKDGYLVANPRIARTGIQLYQGHEVGRPDLKQVRVYRPESEVMDRAAVSSLAGKPVTIEHPDNPINSRNWKDFAVGYLGDEILRDGEFLRVPLHLMDAQAIEIVRGGRKQLSVGYSAVLQWGDGKTEDGESYDAIQTAIRANHVAITHTARGGDKLRMGDRKQEKAMAKFMVDGIGVELEERDLQVVEKRITHLEKELGTAKSELTTSQATLQKDIAAARTETANATALAQTKDAEIATLKQQLADSKITPQKLDQMVNDRAKVVTRAKSIIGDAVVVDGKTDEDIRRQVVNAKLGETAKDWTDDMISASFNTLTVATKDSDDITGLRHVANVLQYNEPSGDARTKAYSEYDEALSNRWKTAGIRAS